MTTSGVTTLSVTRDEIIFAALEDIGVYAPGMDTPTADEVAGASMRLNMMIKAFQAAGVGLWLNQLSTLILQSGAQSYLLGPTGTHCSAAMKETAIATAAVLGAATITVDDDTDITNGDFIGVELDDGTIQWTTVNGAPAANVVTLTAVLTGAAAIGNVVFNYTTKIAKPLAVLEARIRTVDGNDTPLYSSSRQEYMNLPLKSSTGRTSQYTYESLSTDGVLYVWPVETDLSNRIVFTAKTPIQTFVNIADNPDFPSEWFDVLHFSLALRLCPAYKVGMNEYNRIKEMTQIALKDADDFDREQNVSVFLQPSFGYRG